MEDFNVQMKNHGGEGVLYDGNTVYQLADTDNKTSEYSDIREGAALKKLISFAGTRKILDRVNKNPPKLYTKENYEIIKSAVLWKNVMSWATAVVVILCLACIGLIIWQVAARVSNPLVLGLAGGVLGALVIIEFTYHYVYKHHIIDEYENMVNKNYNV